MYTLYIDGGCSLSNQKNMSIRKMVSIVTDIKGELLDAEERTGGSNNIAEFIALRNALKFLKTKKIKNALIITDSQNNIKWVKRFNPKNKVNDSARVVEIRKEILELINQVKGVKLEWRSRKNNLAGNFIESVYNC